MKVIYCTSSICKGIYKDEGIYWLNLFMEHIYWLNWDEILTLFITDLMIMIHRIALNNKVFLIVEVCKDFDFLKS